MREVRLPFYSRPITSFDDLREKINLAYRKDETETVQSLLNYLNFNQDTEKAIAQLAEKLIQSVRKHHAERSFVEAFMVQYDLSMEEGILMMCLAEALLRVPDKETEQLLLKDKLTSVNWQKHVGESESSIVNLATRGLAFSSKILQKNNEGSYFKSLWQHLVQKSGEPVIRKAVREAMKILSKHFVIGQDIEQALKNSEKLNEQGYRFSYDMLGEVARTQKDADRYYHAYYDAITALGATTTKKGDFFNGPSISIKLSALHPRYEYAQRENMIPALINRVKILVQHAKDNNISVAIDAEEADRLDLSFDIIEAIFNDPDFSEWEGLGLALQTYQKRAFYALDWLIALARQHKKRIQVRLVKGAYWDTEVKFSQVNGFIDYPVFTRKTNTDISYLACAKKMLSAQDAIYPQFATHNAYSVAAIINMLDTKSAFEFQSLQGMGRPLHNEIIAKTGLNLPCRIYAPVGSYQDLLPYLVRRLLENGANSSFVHRISDPATPVNSLIESPLQQVQNYSQIPNPKIPLPKNIFGPARLNSMGMDLSDRDAIIKLSESFVAAEKQSWSASPFLRASQKGQPVLNPADRRQEIGRSIDATLEDVQTAIKRAEETFLEWNLRPVTERAAILRKTADLFEAHRAELMYLAVREAGKTLQDAIAEVREAVDFCRYYAEQAEKHLVDQPLPGPTGEANILRLQGRGTFLCISPWNFPLAIFTGQIAAALVAGNTVIAKPAEQTTLIAALAVKLFYQAGLPETVLQLLPGPGEIIGDALVKNPAIAGILFTGSNETAQLISIALAKRPGPIIPLIAETGGINALIADSTALPEQLVRDVMISAFGSAGQRCSALRLLFIQDEIADRVLEMLAGAMTEISVGDPLLLSTDVGPVIDEAAKKMLLKHREFMRENAKLIAEVNVPRDLAFGTFVGPQAYELPELKLLNKEVFGPILHVVRYKKQDLDRVIKDINHLGYGLTFGIQSRITSTTEYIQRRILAGNIYVNRNMIGAVVGVQPFGGSRLSGTGPKAGGPHYLPRLCQESTLTIDTTAVGGNASLMAMED